MLLNRAADEIFMPKEIDSGTADQFDREIEEFKR
jgi:hypothetical protein